MIGIYKITSPSKRVYIGQSKDVFRRFKDYKYKTNKSQRRLYASFNKYGVDKHYFEVIEICDLENLKDRERYWQEFYDVLSPNGLNCELTDCSNFRRELSDYSKKLIGDKNRGFKNGMYGHKHSEKFKNDRKNYKHTKEAILKIKQSSRGSNNPNAKLVLNLDTGIFYGCVGDAAYVIDVKRDTLKQWLNGRRKNKSNMIYV